MLKNMRLKQLARRSFPSSLYSRKERRIHRTSLYQDMLFYQEKHPESTINDIQRVFCEDSDCLDPAQHTENTLANTRTVLVGLFLVLLVCFVSVAVAGTWEPPSYILP